MAAFDDIEDDPTLGVRQPDPEPLEPMYQKLRALLLHIVSGFRGSAD